MRRLTNEKLQVTLVALAFLGMSCAEEELEDARAVAKRSGSIISECVDDCWLPLDEPVVGWGATRFTSVQVPTAGDRTVAAVLARSRHDGDYYGVGAYTVSDGGVYGDRLLTHGTRAVVLGGPPIHVDVGPIMIGDADGGYYLQYRAFDVPLGLQMGGVLTATLAEADIVYARQVSLPLHHSIRVVADLAAAGPEAAILLAESATYGRGGVHLLSTACDAAPPPMAADSGYSCVPSQPLGDGMQAIEFSTESDSDYDVIVLRGGYFATDIEIRVEVL